jgi:crotonobetainyl-CoA:carnitine CoA-transferase CaiB-like acyl-CoA transferase
MVLDIPHDELGTMRSLGNPIRLSRTPAVIQRPPPGLGEHNAEILESLAADDDEPTADRLPVGATTRGADR